MFTSMIRFHILLAFYLRYFNSEKRNCRNVIGTFSIHLKCVNVQVLEAPLGPPRDTAWYSCTPRLLVSSLIVCVPMGKKHTPPVSMTQRPHIIHPSILRVMCREKTQTTCGYVLFPDFSRVSLDVRLHGCPARIPVNRFLRKVIADQKCLQTNFHFNLNTARHTPTKGSS